MLFGTWLLLIYTRYFVTLVSIVIITLCTPLVSIFVILFQTDSGLDKVLHNFM